ncbi:MAG: cytochrome c [Mangrovicoccus sp.]|nr:cytochrome c [Mangrovicoccus sp.]
MPIRLYLDNSQSPFREIENGERFELDTSALTDGPHRLRIETVEDGHITGNREISFTVRNGPGIAVAGIRPGDELRGAVNVLVNASEAGIDGRFDAHAMETHRGIPFWVGGFAALVILACAAYIATDPFRHRAYDTQASEVAALLGDKSAQNAAPSLPLDAQSAELPLTHPQHLVLADGDFLEIIPVQNLPADPVRGGEIFAAKCSGCHGAKAQGTVQEQVTLADQGIYPRLAGQSRTYLYRQLVSFADGWRDNAQMLPMAKSLSNQDRLDIAAHIESLSPAYPPPGPATPEQLTRGKDIAELGLIEDGVARCSGCHGADGRGGGSNFPALAGQWPQYLESQIHNWQMGSRRNSWRGLMRPVAHSLSDSDIAAVAAYYAHLRPDSDRAGLD